MHYIIFFVIIIITNNVFCEKFMGDSCMLDDNTRGVCSDISNCLHATELIKNRNSPKLCGFYYAEPIVCCPDTDEYVSNEIGKKSRTKCNEYNPRMELLGLAGGLRAKPRQFPHMALIGITKEETIDWLCGGSLISLNFVLTAAHCLYHRSLGKVNWVRLGDLDISTDDDVADPKNFKIREHHIHQEYDAGYHYHDIALLKLSEEVYVNSFIRPACLFTRIILPETEITASGWGVTEFGGDRSNHLLYAKLVIYDYNECNKKFPPHLFRKIPRGIDNEIQICAGGRNEIKDTCEGDSGGPLQINHVDYPNHNVHGVIGVTSFGRACGFINQPGVYVRIYPYIEWIESIVW